MRISFFLAFAAAGVVTGPAIAQPTPQQFIKAWDEASFNCSGSTENEQWRSDECARTSALRAHLNDAGWCFGRREQAQYEKRWHRCDTTSLKPNDVIVSPKQY